MESKENLSQFLSLVRQLKDCINNGNTGNYQVSKIFEIANFVETSSQEIMERDVADELNKQLISSCDMTLEEVRSIGDKILSGFLLLKITDDTARKAISEYITRFGDNRFSSVCHSLIVKRQIFVALSSMVKSQCSDDIITSFLLQIWTKHLKNQPDSDSDRAVQLFDSMLSSEKSFKILARVSKFGNIEDWKRTIDLIYSRAVLKLKPFNFDFWSWFVDSKQFFQNVVENNRETADMIYDTLIKSGKISKSFTDNSKTYSANCLNINQIVLTLHNLLTLECTFNKTKQFLEEQKSGGDADFWIDIENHYLEFRTKSPSLLVNKQSRLKKSS